MSELGQAITTLISGVNISETTALRCMEMVLRDEANEMEQGAYLAALSAKGPTVAEMAATTQAILALDTSRVTIAGKVLDNSGSGMSRVKTFNITTAATVVAASCGAKIARHAARALPGRCDVVALLEKLGINVEAHVDRIKTSVEQCGIGLFSEHSPQVHPRALGRILSRLSFGNVLNISASLANPATPTLAVRGANTPEMIGPTIRLLRKLGFKRAIVVTGLDSHNENTIDEASVFGKTKYAELNAGAITFGEFTSADFGIPVGEVDEVLFTGDIDNEACRFRELLAGRENASRNNITALNAALVLYIGGVAASIREGVRMAQEALATGAPAQTLAAWTRLQQ